MLHGLPVTDDQDLDRGWKLIASMKEFGLIPDTVTMNTMTDMCVRAGAFGSAEKVSKDCFF